MVGCPSVYMLSVPMLLPIQYMTKKAAYTASFCGINTICIHTVV